MILAGFARAATPINIKLVHCEWKSMVYPNTETLRCPLTKPDGVVVDMTSATALDFVGVLACGQYRKLLGWKIKPDITDGFEISKRTALAVYRVIHRRTRCSLELDFKALVKGEKVQPYVAVAIIPRH
jgi:hypothetical protein